MDGVLPSTECETSDTEIVTCLRTGNYLSLSQLKDEAHVLSRALGSCGLHAGDRLTYQVQAGLDLYPFVVACSHLGLKLSVVQGEVPVTGRGPNAPRLVVCSTKPAKSGPECIGLDELRLIGLQSELSDRRSDGDQPGLSSSESGLVWTIRPLRTPLSVSPSPHEAADGPGEIVLSSPAAGKVHPDTAPEHRTGHIGWTTETGTLIVAGMLAEVAIRGRHAKLLSDLNDVLQAHPAVRASWTFREHGVSPTENIVSVCVTDLGEPDLRRWLADRIDKVWIPNRLVILPKLPGELGAEPIDAIRAMVNGSTADAAVAAMTSRRFRRSPCFKESQLRDLVQSTLMGGRSLEFLLFWGCGSRDFASAPDHVALEALDDFLAAVGDAAPVAPRASIIFTDGHASNNGHSAAHARSYFDSIKQAAGHLSVRFHLESEVWRRGGLTKAMICELEQTPDFQTKWQEFPLRDRFVKQAGRHSRMTDQIAAARHYYATCLLEREVLKDQFENFVFLTYNGPEFNECFPDLPTLYVYPGPRGRTDKPWFVHDEDHAIPGMDLAVAAE